MHWSAVWERCRLLQNSGPADEPCNERLSLSCWGHKTRWTSMCWMVIFQHSPLSKRPCKLGEAAGLYYPWTGFHRAETHALPHSSSLHNWKHLGMKIESRWHINGRILQGHADKKSLLLLMGGCWPSLKETAGDWMLSYIQKAVVDQWSGVFSGTVQSQQISSPASTTKPFLLPSLASRYVQVEGWRVSAAQHKETCVKLYPSAGSMNGNPSLWTLITQLLWLFYRCLLHEYNFCTHREQVWCCQVVTCTQGWPGSCSTFETSMTGSCSVGIHPS